MNANLCAPCRSTMPAMQTLQRRSFRYNRLPQQRGFTLLELVAAFVIFAISFSVLMGVLTSSIQNVRRSAEYTQAALWAQSLLDVVGVGERLKEGGSNGRFDNNYRWDLRISKFQPPAASQFTAEQIAPVDLYQLDLNVSWNGTSQQRQARFVTLRANTPQPAGQPGA